MGGCLATLVSAPNEVSYNALAIPYCKEGPTMFRMWCKIFKENRLLKDVVIIKENPEQTRTSKVLESLEEACIHFDLAVPIWLDVTIKDFRRYDKARFTADNFIDSIDFDYLEIHVIEED